jgi:hypothetical protein
MVQSGQPLPIQRAKIDHRAVTWDDFKGSSPGTYPAVTHSGIVSPPGSPKLVKEATDSGTSCGKGKQTTWDATTAIDPATFAKVKGTMDTARSGVQKTYRAGTVGVADGVKACTKSYAPELKEATKEATTTAGDEVKKCKQAFKDGETEYAVEFDGTQVKAVKASECATSFKAEVKKHNIAGYSYGEYSYTFGTGSTPKGCNPFQPSVTGTATASKPDDCKGDFKAALTKLGGQESQRLLAHEQVHFNISESKAMGLKSELETAAGAMNTTGSGCGKAKARSESDKAFNKLKAGPELTKLVKAATKDLADTQKEYDAATCHGLDQTNQDAWSSQYPT